MGRQDRASCLQLLFYNAGDKIRCLFKNFFSMDMLSLSRFLYVERQDRASCLWSSFYIARDKIDHLVFGLCFIVLETR